MMSPILIALCSLTLVTADCSSRSAPADVASVDVRSQQVSFVKDYMAARHSKDAARIYNLIHPGVRACMTGQNKAYFDFVINHMLHDAPSGNYTKLTIKPVTPKTPPVLWAFVPAKWFPYPVRPTHDIQIDYQNGPTSFESDIIEVAPSGGSWYLVEACPNEQGLRFMRESQAQGARQEAQAKKLASEVRDPLLSQIKALLAQHHKIEAIKAYQKATGTDLTTADSVINVIQGPNK